METSVARKAIENMMFYLYNKFNENESVLLFGNGLGTHLWNKFYTYKFDGFRFFGECDSEIRDILVERANKLYN